jgi:hypothetical protein
MKKLAILLITLTVAALAAGATGCGGGENATPTGEIEGPLPNLHIGDKWVSRVTSVDLEYTITEEVTGEDMAEGKDCYVVDASFDPPVGGAFDSARGSLEKATMFPIRVEMSGEPRDVPVTMMATHSYQFTGEPLYPLYVGKEIEVAQTTTTTIALGGESDTETETETYTYKVETIEDITVAAGTFRCFKVVRYDEQGTALASSWESPETRQHTVKEISHVDGEATELISYSLH